VRDVSGRVAGAVAAAAALASACGPAARITEVVALDPSCQPIPGAPIARGTLDLSGGGTYIIGLRVEGQSGPLPITQLEVRPTSRHPFIAFSPSDETLNIRGGPLGGMFQVASGDVVVASVLTPAMLTTLSALDSTVVAELTLHITLHGPSGGTDTLNFPIDVGTTGTCAPPAPPLFANGPCGTLGGQDGVPIICD
jgi:hypothetical protein